MIGLIGLVISLSIQAVVLTIRVTIWGTLLMVRLVGELIELMSSHHRRR